MNTTQSPYRWLVGLAVAVFALGFGAGPAFAGNVRPAGVTPAQYRAMMIRGQALNEKYGLGVPHGMTAAQYRALVVRGQALNEKYGLGGPSGMTAAQWQAQVERGKAMNAFYGAQPSVTASPPATPVVAEASSGFDWTDASIGAAAAVGAVALAAGLGLGARRAERWHPHVRAS
ncbi:MAG: hypothetical protein ACM3QU_09160 [Verrucomicrobiota bacterium]